MSIPTRNELRKKAFVLKVIPFLKDVYDKTKLGYNTINVKDLNDKHSIQPLVVPTMLDLKILTHTGSKKNAMYYWKGGLVNDELAEKIFDRIEINRNREKINNQLAKNHSSKISSRNLVKVVGSKRPMEFANNFEGAAVLRSLKAVYAVTSNGYIKTSAMILDIIEKETVNEDVSRKILKALKDSNFIAVSREISNAEFNLYAWKESEPNEEAALFIQELMNEEQVGSTSRVDRIYEFLVDLYKFKDFTSFKMRNESKKHNLSSNDQSVITSSVLEFRGPKVGREYKWKLSEGPSMKLAEELRVKTIEYGAKYTKPSVKKSEVKTAPVTTPVVVHFEIPKYGEKTQVIVDHLKKHNIITTDEACELVTMDKHSVSNIFWRLSKDGVVSRIAHKQYELDDKFKVIPLLKKPIAVEKKKVETVIKKEETKMVTQLAPFKEDSFITNLRSALTGMKSKQTQLESELKELNAKIKEGEDLLKVKEKENSFLASCSKFISPNTEVISSTMNSASKDRKRHSHDRETILSTLGQKEQVSLDEFIELFYPGKGLNWSSAEVKSLSAMIYSLKKDGKIISPSNAIYSLKKN